MTFSICARDPRSGVLGVAVATKNLAVGALVTHVAPDQAAIATQAATNPLLGLQILQARGAAKKGSSTFDEDLKKSLASDPNPQCRQVHGVDFNGDTIAWTGVECVEWAGHLTENGVSVAGNMLVGPDVIKAMLEEYLGLSLELPLAARLIAALEAGQQAGGDKRGQQSSALKVYNQQPYPLLDLRVDDDPQPIRKLAQLYDLSQEEDYQSFRSEMPTI